MPLCKACGEDPNHHHCLPFCPRCKEKMSSHKVVKRENGHVSHCYTYYACPKHGKQEPVMRDLCPLCGAEIEVEKKVDDFHVDVHGPSGRLAHPFMYNYYVKGVREISAGVELLETAIVPMNRPELWATFKSLVDKGIFTIERELKLVRIDPDALEEAVADGFVELRFIEMLKEIKGHGFFKENPHIAVEVKEE